VKSVKTTTQKLWQKQNQHEGDRWRLFSAIAREVEVARVFYPGCFVDISPSFVFPEVTYLDMDKRTPGFFRDVEGILEIIAQHAGAPENPSIQFLHGDFTRDLDLPKQHFDLLVSLYAGFISEHCTDHLKVGGTLLVNPSHGDAAMASIDSRYELSGVIVSRDGDYRVRRSDLDSYLIPKKPVKTTKALLHRTCRGIAYTRSAFAYLFTRVR
jgi:hypothetical protein